jgi:hypothetical protein
MIKDLPQLMLNLGEPLGWDSSFKNNIRKQDDYLEELNITTYNSFKEYSFLSYFNSFFFTLTLLNLDFSRRRGAKGGSSFTALLIPDTSR